MSTTPSAQHRTVDTPLRNKPAIKDVTGGTETNPMWVSKVSSSDFEKALEASLKSAGLLADRQAGDFVLTADLMKLEQPFIGLDMRVTSSVGYMVIDRSSGKTAFTKWPIKSSSLAAKKRAPGGAHQRRRPGRGPPQAGFRHNAEDGIRGGESSTHA